MERTSRRRLAPPRSFLVYRMTASSCCSLSTTGAARCCGLRPSVKAARSARRSPSFVERTSQVSPRSTCHPTAACSPTRLRTRRNGSMCSSRNSRPEMDGGKCTQAARRRASRRMARSSSSRRDRLAPEARPRVASARSR